MGNYPAATISATEVRLVKAKRVKQDFQISVALPASYFNKPRSRFPAIYVLDGNWYFGMVTEMARIMPLCGSFPEAIIVGIGYPVAELVGAGFQEYMALRSRDLTPVVDKNDTKVETGGAKLFLRFLSAELIPLIEAEYRCRSSERVLAGHSYGGLFALYALLNDPGLFAGIVAASPSLWFGDKVTFELESRYAKTHKSLTSKLYLSAGEREEYPQPEPQMVSDMVQLAARLESRKYKGLKLTRHILAGTNHCGTPAPAFQAGLWAVMAR